MTINSPYSTKTKTVLIIASTLMGVGVILGAFGAHGLKHIATAQTLEWWHTATLYLFIHALGLLLVGILHHIRLCNHRPAYCLGMGIAIFSGSLYGMTLGLPRWFGAITPIGGTLLVIGWFWLVWQLTRRHIITN